MEPSPSELSDTSEVKLENNTTNIEVVSKNLNTNIGIIKDIKKEEPPKAPVSGNVCNASQIPEPLTDSPFDPLFQSQTYVSPFLVGSPPRPSVVASPVSSPPRKIQRVATIGSPVFSQCSSTKN